jgi:prepilin-type N-terminal cleavage/methylation domain-containing protein
MCRNGAIQRSLSLRGWLRQPKQSRGAKGLPRTPTCHCEEPSSLVIARSAATKQSRGKAIATHPAGPRNDTMRKDENMKRIRLSNKTRKTLQGHSRGFTLIEVVIAIALIGLIGAAVLSALSTASLALIIADQRATAESIARSQMEYVKNQGYIDYSLELSDPERAPDFYVQITIPGGAGNCTLATKAEPIDPNTYRPYLETVVGSGVYQDDDDIQQITVTVTYQELKADNRMRGRQYVLVDYKRNPEI